MSKKLSEMTSDEKEECKFSIQKINKVDDLLDCLEDELLNIIKENNQRNEITELFDFYHNCMIDEYENDDCPELVQNVITDPLSVTLLKRYEKDLFDAEYYLNTKLNVETRRGKDQDDFRSMKSICKDIAKAYGVDVD